ncbi:hypothetical protein ACQ4PT_050234 [Festuca glaucescens]
MEEADAEAIRALYHGLVGTGKLREEELSSFRRHFDRLPSSYLTTRYMWPGPDDVLLDRMVLADADANKRIAAHARFIQRVQLPCNDDGFGGPPDQAQPTLPELRQEEMLVHEIIFASRDRPGLLSQLSTLMNRVRLHIREAHIFTTTDGFCLSIFHVDGWSREDVKGLIEAIQDELIREKVYNV